MPTFSYRCNSCQRIFEMILKIGENELPSNEPCPYCHQFSVQQTISYANPLADPYSIGRYHHTDEWRSVLKRIKDNHPGSKINIP